MDVSLSDDATVSAIISHLDPAAPDKAVEAARTLKNLIVGNPTNKRLVVSHGALHPLLHCAALSSTYPVLSDHAIAALGSLAPFLPSHAIPSLVSVVIRALFSPHIRPVHSALLSLKFLFCSTDADPTPHILPPVATRLVDLLSTSSDPIAEVCALILSHTVHSPDHAIIYTQANAIPALVSFLSRTHHQRCIHATVDALTVLARHSPHVSPTLTNSSTGILSELVLLSRSPIHSLRLAVCRLLTTFHSAAHLPPHLHALVTTKLVNLLNHVPSHELPNAARALSELVSNSPELQRVATNAGAVCKLSLILLPPSKSPDNSNTSPPKPDKRVYPSQTPPHLPLLSQTNVLIALAALMSEHDPARDAVISQHVLPVIVKGLSHSQNSIVKASIQCVRSLSRSVKILRRDIEKESIGEQMLVLVKNPDVEIQRCASATLCNLVLEFSSVRDDILSHGGTSILVNLLGSADTQIRKNGLWALKNVLFRADPETKSSVLSLLRYDDLHQLFVDKEPSVRELTMTIVRNLAYSPSAEKQSEQLDALFTATGEQLVPLLSEALKTSDTNVEMAVQTLYAVCNIASGTEQHKAFLLQSDIPELILKWTSHEDERARIAAVWCAINLSWKERVVVSPRRETRTEGRVVRRSWRSARRDSVVRRRFEWLRQQHLPLPSSAQGRRILERYNGDGANRSINGDVLVEESDEMWVVDEGQVEGEMEDVDTEMVPSETNLEDNRRASQVEDESPESHEDENEMDMSVESHERNAMVGGTDEEVLEDENRDLNGNSHESGDDYDADSSIGSGGEKAGGYEWRIERLRQLGFEGRLRSLVNDPHIEVQGRARAALEFFDCDSVRRLDYDPSSLLDNGSGFVIQRSQVPSVIARTNNSFNPTFRSTS